MGILGGLGAVARRKGLRRGLIGGNRAWMLVGAAAWAIRFARRLGAKDETVISTESLKPGETLIIETHARPTRRQRRAERRASTRSASTPS